MFADDTDFVVHEHTTSQMILSCFSLFIQKFKLKIYIPKAGVLCQPLLGLSKLGDDIQIISKSFARINMFLYSAATIIYSNQLDPELELVCMYGASKTFGRLQVCVCCNRGLMIKIEDTVCRATVLYFCIFEVW